MKNLVLLLVLALCFASCESPKRYLEVKVIDVINFETFSTVTCIVTNNSDMDIYSIVELKYDGDIEDVLETECLLFTAHQEKDLHFMIKCGIDEATAKIKKCE